MHVHVDVNSWERVTLESHEHWSPANIDDSTALQLQFSETLQDVKYITLTLHLLYPKKKLPLI